MTAAIFSLGLLSFALSWVLTWAMKRVAPRFNFVDKPGHRKIHHTPIPLGGGVAIFLAFALPLLAGLVFVNFQSPWMTATYADGQVKGLGQWPGAQHWPGARQQTPLALGLLAATLGMHLLGLRDDRRAMGPFSKLFIQLAITAAFVIYFDVRALTALDNLLRMGRWPSVVLTVLWIGAITNAFNFLDNMDGLSAGVAAVCTAAFLVTAISIQQWFVAATLSLLLGALLGFLCFNFAPASIFMGDSGSLVIGFILGVLTVRTTFLRHGQEFGAGWYAVFAPLIVLAVPLYDLLVVSAIRISRGRSPFVGDTNHFSHRLVARGMSKRTAVLCIYLVTAATSVAAIILPHTRSPLIAALVFAQTVLILGVVALLEQHPLPVVVTVQPKSAQTTPTGEREVVTTRDA
ncbi:MAG TPA: MraY family glycosyltransferase [Tepidisphaeraceae bacterium]|nr:MraY family glycosyltransferase [Tepidisphaeraceae bacterium]